MFGPSPEMFSSAQDGQEVGNNDSDFELIQPSDTPSPPIRQEFQDIQNQFETIEDNQHAVIPIVHQASPWVLFLFFLLAFIAFDFWAEATHLFLRQKYHSGRAPSWKWAVLYAFLITIFFVLVIWMAGIPVTTFEMV